jgi:hypothetical protein
VSLAPSNAYDSKLTITDYKIKEVGASQGAVTRPVLITPKYRQGENEKVIYKERFPCNRKV